MASKKNSKNSKKGKKKEDSGLWPVIGAAVVLVLVIAAILLSAGEKGEYPVVTTEQAAKEAFRARNISEVIVTDLSRDFASGNITLSALVTKYPGFEEDILAVNEKLSTTQNSVVATVDGVEITQTDLDTQLALLPDQYRQVLSDEQVLQEMIDEKLLLAEAARRGIVPSDAELELAYQELFFNNELTEEQVAENLAIFGLDLDDMRQMLKRQQTIEKLFAETVDVNLTPSSEEVRAYYDENKASFQSPEEVTVKHILIAKGDQQPADVLPQAEAVLARYEDGEDFCDLVTEFTADLGSKDSCGEYTFPKGFMVPEFEVASFEMENGETRIVETQFGQHIILKVSHQEAETKSFSEVEADIVALLAGDARRVAYADFIEELRANAVITYGEPETPETEYVPVEITPEPEVEEEVVEPEPVACTLDAKECPDGSFVGRVAPDCDFEACPALPPVPVVEEPAPVDDLASCLRSKSVTLYIADWAPASMDEATKYGSMVVVKDCSDGCAAAEAFPTWNIDGNTHLGSLAEHELAALAGC